MQSQPGIVAFPEQSLSLGHSFSAFQCLPSSQRLISALQNPLGGFIVGFQDDGLCVPFTAERKKKRIKSGDTRAACSICQCRTRECSAQLCCCQHEKKKGFKYHPAWPREVFIASGLFFLAEMKSRTQKGSGEARNDQPLSAESKRFLYFYLFCCYSTTHTDVAPGEFSIWFVPIKFHWMI